MLSKPAVTRQFADVENNAVIFVIIDILMGMLLGVCYWGPTSLQLAQVAVREGIRITKHSCCGAGGQGRLRRPASFRGNPRGCDVGVGYLQIRRQARRTGAGFPELALRQGPHVPRASPARTSLGAEIAANARPWVS